MDVNKTYKTASQLITIEATAKAPVNTGAIFYSHDVETAKIALQLMKDGTPQLLPQGTVVPILLRFSDPDEESGEGRHYYNATIDDSVNGLVSIVLTKESLLIQGKVNASVYIELPNQQSLDTAGRFTFSVNRSEIDNTTDKALVFFYSGFGEINDKYVEMFNLINSNVNSLDAKLEQQAELFENASTYSTTEINNKLSAKANKTDLQQGLAKKVDSKYVDDNIAKIDNGKVDKDGIEQIEMKNLSQTVRESMTGGSVAVVGKDGVSTTNIVDKAITNPKIANSAVSRNKLSYWKSNFTNMLNIGTYVENEYYNKTGTLVTANDAGYLAGFGRSDFFEVSQGDVLYRNNLLGRTLTGDIFITYWAEDTTTFISGVTWKIVEEISSTVVPENAVYATVAWHNNDLANCFVTKNEFPFYTDPLLGIGREAFYSNGISRQMGYLSQFDPSVSDWTLKVDFVNKEFTISKSAAFLNYGNGLAWLYGNAINNASDVVISFDEIDPNGSAGYYWVFVKKDIRPVDYGKAAFKFLLSGGISNQDEDMLKSYVMIGVISKTRSWADFPNTKFLVVTSDKRIKKLSILGDSISSFAGYIPDGNVSFFPNAFITDVSQTWWKKLLRLSEGTIELLVDNAWSGSRVSTTDGEDAAGVTRSTQLHSGNVKPDIIINYIGINDFDYKVDIGTYDFKSTLPTSTDTFSEAYVVMLQNETENYPDAKIYCCTLPYNTRNDGTMPRTNTKSYLSEYNEVIRKASELFGAELIKLDRIGLNANNHTHYLGDGLHPKPAGMNLIANKIYKAITD